MFGLFTKRRDPEPPPKDPESPRKECSPRSALDHVITRMFLDTGLTFYAGRTIDERAAWRIDYITGTEVTIHVHKDVLVIQGKSPLPPKPETEDRIEMRIDTDEEGNTLLAFATAVHDLTSETLHGAIWDMAQCFEDETTKLDADEVLTEDM